MEKDPIDTLAKALFVVGMLASLVIAVLPDRSSPKCSRDPLWCRCGAPLGPTAKARGE